VIGDVLDRFAYLRMALAALLVFVAGKPALSPFLHIPSGASLLVIAAVLALAAAASRLLSRPGRKQRIAANCADRH
jgi:predicted tellurium resistance membrane protein TerC